ncbi:MAG: DUF1624 domain-containing protein [Hyphomicrobiaceae bacterium]|nr:DUF1624 domain-containing protein [Hyphomicrobiaceae bacterium]
MSADEAGKGRLPRVEPVDVVRGLAILGVILFHTVWDLRFFGFTTYDPVWDPVWLGFAKVLVNTFLGLVGVSLVLAHQAGIDWPKFWRRWLILLAAALAVSIVTYFAFGEAFVYFGVLHAIALYSLMGLVALRWPVWVIVLAALAFIVPPHLWPSETFNVKWLAWIGFWTEHPNTEDLVPIFPSFGAVLVGMAIGRVLTDGELGQRMARFRPGNRVWRALIWCGRWSLVLYLLHQLVIFGLLFGLDKLMQPAHDQIVTGFRGQCEVTCAGQGGGAGYCSRYCDCALGIVEDENLWDLINQPNPDAAMQTRINGIAALCRAMATAGPIELQPKA